MHLSAASTGGLLLILSLLNPIDCDQVQDKLEAGWTGYCGNSRYDNVSTQKKAYFYDRDQSWQLFRKYLPAETSADKPYRALELTRRWVYVRLGLVFDKTLTEEFKYKESMVEFARNLIYSTQLIFEQPPMIDSLRVIFLISNIKNGTLDYDPASDVIDILGEFGRSSDYDDDLDLNILLTFRNLWDRKNSDRNQPVKTVGLANVGTFCRPSYHSPKVLIVSVTSLGSSIVLAHELAHSFNVFHDATPDYSIEKHCPENFIMAPRSGPDRRNWSKCTVNAILDYFTSDEVFNCIFDQNRVLYLYENRTELDFGPNAPGRLPLPGEKMDIERQCKFALDYSAASSLKAISSNGRDIGFGTWTTCNELFCSMGSVVVPIGPAIPGSYCLTNDKEPGTCRNVTCAKGVN